MIPCLLSKELFSLLKLKAQIPSLYVVPLAMYSQMWKGMARSTPPVPLQMLDQAFYQTTLRVAPFMETYQLFLFSAMVALFSFPLAISRLPPFLLSWLPPLCLTAKPLKMACPEICEISLVECKKEFSQALVNTEFLLHMS